MYFKISLKNVKKSYKDYALYFLTLTFGVCIFYVFNSIEAQQAMMKISASTAAIMKTLTDLMGAISIFVSFILGFLIVYANNFLIKKRKKEFGIYMTLGMEKGNVSRVLAAETFLIGVLSLGAGLLAGIFLSQGLSVVTAKIFEADMAGYTFIFSPAAFVKTIIYFGIIFLVVMVMSTISISKYKLIDLINAGKQNEKPKLKSPVLTVILFLLSVAFLGTAYGMVLKNGIETFDNRLILEIILGAIGTFLFFASLSGFFLKLIQSNKRLYLKELNMFILRQINSRINTAHISISLICLMLFCTIGILSTGLGMTSVLNRSYRSATPYDVSFRTTGSGNIEGRLKTEYGININEYTDRSVEYSLYQYKNGKLTKNIILEYVKDIIPEDDRRFVMDTPLPLLKLSDYNNLMDLQGGEGISLSQNQVALYSDYVDDSLQLKAALEKFIEKKYPVTISGKEYGAYSSILSEGIITSPASGIIIALVVPDAMVEGSEATSTMLSFNLRGDNKSNMERFESDFLAAVNKNKDKSGKDIIAATTKNDIKSIAAGSTALISFVGIYLGIIFVITSAAILALQQLSEVSDNKHRYEILRKVGADDKLINGALFKQIAIYFILPLALACIHAVVGIKVANDAIRDIGSIDATGNIIITAVLIAIVYGAYFIATFMSSKRMVLKSRM